MNQLTTSPIWQELRAHHGNIANLHMRELFESDAQRFEKFSLAAAGIFLDYSKNRINQRSLALLCALAQHLNLSDKITQLFSGKIVNESEQRPALHTALRQQTNTPLFIDGKDIISDIRTTNDKLAQLTNQILQQKKITDVVNIGVGGSDLGAATAIEALKPYAVSELRFHFISNIDGTHLSEILKKTNPATTLFIVASKNFTTQETLFNAYTLKNFLHTYPKNFFAITANPERAVAFGISAENILPIWNWVGGRYSLWSAMGFPIRLQIGNEHFNQLLAGAAAMDNHFYTAPFAENMPVILALLSIWYSNFFETHSHAILPYDQQLQLLPTYLQQLQMESLGKRVRNDGEPVNYETGTVSWGNVGTNGQHTFHQLFYQGTHLIPIDFILAREPHHHLNEHQRLLFANCLSQSRALMLGKNQQEVLAELIESGIDSATAEKIAPHRVIPGNCPSNTLLIQKLTPYTLGALLALYEHKVFTQAAIWNINCFDQWGVELGKHLAKDIASDLQSQTISEEYDASTRGLMAYYLEMQTNLVSS